MWMNHFEINVFWTAFQGFFKLQNSLSSILGLWWISMISEFSFLGIGFIMKTQKSRKIFIFWFKTLQWMFDHHFNCLNVKTGINKNRLNLRYSEGSKNFKTQLAAAGLAMWLNHSETDVTFDWLSFFEVAYSHFSILRFLKNLWDFRVFELARNCNFVKKRSWHLLPSGHT